MLNSLSLMQTALIAEIDTCERIAEKTDADLFSVEKTGFFSRKLAESKESN